MSKTTIPSSEPATWDSAPPPYSEHNYGNTSTEQVLQYEVPYFNNSTSDSTRLQAATSKFPADDEWLHSHETHPRVSLGTISFGEVGELQENSIVEPLEDVKPGRRMSPTFSIAVDGSGKDASYEQFEWRSSHGKEIKERAGHTSGWKLVRLSETVSEAGGSRSHRAMGCSSDGKEIVAVIAHNASWSLSKGFKFAFVGSGLTGVLGERWEIMTLMTAVHLWLIELQIVTKAIPIA
ncbi:hypothetical protein BDV41DRAFT_573018 [Aspergillus transmontanensis]|uniref:Uncharacterized protein n=1 Tax=Aspergillus transmontanensis TaxID=1034304 RepID=A0A5N6W985_9EURO|nr:hypothetical protein BDV41DRAFT_573018 [Aspergillus transmontanensis]